MSAPALPTDAYCVREPLDELTMAHLYITATRTHIHVHQEEPCQPCLGDVFGLGRYGWLLVNRIKDLERELAERPPAEKPAREPGEDVSDEDLAEICNLLSDTKRYMQRLVAKDSDGFVAVIANDNDGNPTEISFAVDRRIVFTPGNGWAVTS